VRVKIFDAHLHIINPKFPLQTNQGFRPEPFLVDDYLEQTDAFERAGGAVVSGSFQGFDQQYLVEALHKLGDSYVGVTQLPPDSGPQVLRELDDAGVRAVRFNLRRGVAGGFDSIEPFARRIYETVGWHGEFYLTGEQLHAYSEQLDRLPVVVIDHLGLDIEGHDILTELARQGAYVKATGFGRIAFEPEPVLRRIADANPRSLLFGTDLPGTRAERAFEPGDIERLKNALTDSQLRAAVLDNARELYFRST
jgi:predicted TIM-barrel fold metal-dependent hydrolase